jgi:CBS domain containing-hemolysin-like protein
VLLAIGLALSVAVVYFSTLSYALRIYSRPQLLDRLDESRRQLWRPRLDSHDSELQTAISLLRLLLVTSLVLLVYYPLIREGAGLITSKAIVPTLVNLAVLLFFAIGIPHSLALHAGEAVLAAGLELIWAVRLALYPLVRLLALVEVIVQRLLGKTPDASQEVARVEQEILDVVSEGELQGAVAPGQKGIIQSVLELSDTPVSTIMTPRTDIQAIQADLDLEQTRQFAVEGGHSRIPVFESSVDHIVGVLYAKDLLRLKSGDAFDLRRLMRPALYVPESKSISELLNEFRARKVHIAIVLDEYGGTAGLATIEDILEQLVGEIDDEYDAPVRPPLRRISDNVIEVEARVHVSEINEALGISLPEDGDYDTIGGFVFAALGKIPQVGEELMHDQVRIRVLDAEPRKINLLRIELVKQDQPV